MMSDSAVPVIKTDTKQSLSTVTAFRTLLCFADIVHKVRQDCNFMTLETERKTTATFEENYPELRVEATDLV